MGSGPTCHSSLGPGSAVPDSATPDIAIPDGPIPDSAIPDSAVLAAQQHRTAPQSAASSSSTR